MKTVFITGCANGIGRCLTETLYTKGYQVVGTDIEILPLLEAVEGIWKPEQYLIEPMDVTNTRDWDFVMGLAVRRFGQIF